MSPGPASLSAAGIAQEVFDVEAGLDLTQPAWMQDDVHWWPLYRLELYRLLFASQAGAAAPLARGGPAERSRLHQLRHMVGPALQRSRSTPAVAPGAVWLVSDGLSWSRLGDIDVERFCTPLQQWCSELGLQTVLVDRASPAPRAGQALARWCAPMLQRQKIAAALVSRLRPSRRHAALVQQVQDAAARAGVALAPLPARRIEAMARAVSIMAPPLQQQMQAERVRAVFVVSYYDVTGYAYILAAARAGVPAIDVQHGVTGPHHLGYAPWPAVPGCTPGFRLLPSHFWCWSAADAALVNGWGSHHQPSRQAVVGGHPFLQAWETGLLQLPPEMHARMQVLLQQSHGRLQVLVTLQPGLTHAEAIEPLTQAWKMRPTASWWLRLHPMALAEGPAITALAQSCGVESFDIDTATALPLPALLAQAHVHVTHSSSTVIEAQTMGLPSVLWSGYGAELGAEQVASGDATVALDGESLVRALHQAVNRRSAAPRGPVLDQIAPGDNASTLGVSALRSLLELPA
jgi:hypothetical protein